MWDWPKHSTPVCWSVIRMNFQAASASAWDVTIQQQVLGLLQRLQKEKGLSYLLITHDVDVIRAMAHDVVVMKDGAVLEGGSVNDVLDAPQHPYTQRLVAAATVPGIG